MVINASKTCTKCKETKSLMEFKVRSGKPGKYLSWCKVCYRKHQLEHYHASPERRKRIRKANSFRLIQKKERVCEYLYEHPCIDCGEKDIVVLDFDHVRDKKESSIANLLLANASWLRISKEMAKCEVRCGNCHRKVTAKRRILK